jgi:hypothetical protein
LTGRPDPAAVLCPNCGASSPAGVDTCPACGAPLPAPLQESGFGPGPQAGVGLQSLIDESHAQLVTTSTNASETAFAVSCTLGVLASAALGGIVFLAVPRGWTVLAVTLLISGLISVTVSSLLASRARSATLRTTFERRVRPEILRYLNTSGLTRQELTASAALHLPEDSPLLAFLSGGDSLQELPKGDAGNGS